jgi:hypothetical protein
MATDFSPKTPNEKLLYGFNFQDLLASGESINAATFTMFVDDGTDPNPSAMLSGGPVLNMSPIVRHLVVGGVSGVTYALVCLVETTKGQHIETTALLKVL